MEIADPFDSKEKRRCIWRLFRRNILNEFAAKKQNRADSHLSGNQKAFHFFHWKRRRVPWPMFAVSLSNAVKVKHFSFF